MPQGLAVADSDAKDVAKVPALRPNSGDDEVISVTDSSSEGVDDITRPESSKGPYGEAMLRGRVVVYTDGACRNNQSRAMRVDT